MRARVQRRRRRLISYPAPPSEATLVQRKGFLQMHNRFVLLPNTVLIFPTPESLPRQCWPVGAFLSSLPVFPVLRSFERLRRSQTGAPPRQVTTPGAVAAPPSRPVWPATQAAEAAREWPTEPGRDWFWPADSRDVLAELPLPPGPFDLDCPALCWRTLARNEPPFLPLYQSTYIPLERVPDFVEGEAARGSAPFHVARSTKGALFDGVGCHTAAPRVAMA